MTLVSYSESEDDTDQTNEPAIHDLDAGRRMMVDATLKRKRLECDEEPAQRASKPAPSLPANFHTLYATNVRASTTDDPSLHGGRQRQVPHIVGHWPSFVYLEWLPSDEDLAYLDQVIDEAAKDLQASFQDTALNLKLHSLLRSDLGVRLPLHTSLSSPLTLTAETKDAFEQELTRAIQDAAIPAFEVSPSGIRWVSNCEKSRHFLILTLTKPRNDQLVTLLSTCNSVARRFSLPELYSNKESTTVGVHKHSGVQLGDEGVINPVEADDMFHVSIGWTLVEPNNDTCKFDKDMYLKLMDISLPFEAVLVKIGNNVSTVALQGPTVKTSQPAPTDDNAVGRPTLALG